MSRFFHNPDAVLALLDQRPPDFDVARWALEEARRLVLEHLRGGSITPYLYGSRAWGTPRAFSDIDIALDGHGRAVPSEIVSAIREDLEESCIPFRADVTDMALLPEPLRTRVRTEGIPWNA